jgi:hypothetical protein
MNCTGTLRIVQGLVNKINGVVEGDEAIIECYSQS